MNTQQIQALIELNNGFYERVFDSFSKTRQSPWQGWTKLLPYIEQTQSLNAGALTILDLACGNMRFKKFLDENLDQPANVIGIDSCAPLAECGVGEQFVSCDLLETLLGGSGLVELPNMPKADVAVCFGFMHHIPTFELRKVFLEQGLDLIKPSGILAVSFWQFLNSPTLAKRAELLTENYLTAHRNCGFEENDWILGWQEDSEALRYCHHASSEELAQMANSLFNKAKLVACYSADGKTGNLNAYLVFKKREEGTGAA